MKPMIKKYPVVILIFYVLSQVCACADQAPLKYEAETARLNSATTTIIAKPGLSGKRGVCLKSEAKPRIAGKSDVNDLIFKIRAPKPGSYHLQIVASLNSIGAQLMREGTKKEEALFIKLRLDDSLAIRRVAYRPADWNRTEYVHTAINIFELTGKEQTLAINLPRGLELDCLKLTPYVPAEIPEAARNYRPAVIPPKEHPRIFMTQSTRPQIRANLKVGENAKLWKQIEKQAVTPYDFKPDPEEEISETPSLEVAIQAKAFYFQMTGDRKIGREACNLLLSYLPRVQFGNMNNITRRIGNAIYAGALTYDYCYDLLAADERALIHKNLQRLAREMECGWPPFEQSVVNGHGSEMQINRDLFSWGIAVFDEDPEPYKLCAYRIWEELIPMRAFEYRSPRHSQGTNYARYRHLCEMHAVWLTYRMTGVEQFAPNIKELGKYFLYMRLPDGEMLRDGDDPAGEDRKKVPLIYLLIANYSRDPILKGEFLLRQKGMDDSLKELGLLINDPSIPVTRTPAGLPLTIDFGPVVGGMVARTGWTMGEDSNDAVVEVKGGGYNSGNHQHADAGSFQIYYRGILAGDLGTYNFYGNLYDMAFNKRSIAHSMMRVWDPGEQTYRNFANDGGTRYFQISPDSVKDVISNPQFRNGTVNYCNFGPDRQHPDYSIWSADLADAYSDKVKAYNRTFCFLNLKQPGRPGIVIIADDLTSRKPGLAKTWQVNTYKPPKLEKDTVVLENQLGGRTGRAHLQMLLPAPPDRTMKIFSGAESRRVGDQLLPIPAGTKNTPEANGSRIEFSPRKANARDRFLTVIQLTDDRTDPYPVEFKQANGLWLVGAGDWLLAINPVFTAKFETWEIEAAVAPRKLLFVGLEAGKWELTRPNGSKHEITIEPGRNTLELTADQTGVYRLHKKQEEIAQR